MSTDSSAASQAPPADEISWGDENDAPQKRNKIAGQWASYPIEMLKSPAWCTLSLGARRFIDRLAIELASHAGKDNGRLPLTHKQCVDYGIHQDAVCAAQREAEALGFCELMERGRGGNANFRKPNLWRITFLNAVNTNPTHEWRRIETVAEAEAFARRARKARQNSHSGIRSNQSLRKTRRRSRIPE